MGILIHLIRFTKKKGIGIKLLKQNKIGHGMLARVENTLFTYWNNINVNSANKNYFRYMVCSRSLIHNVNGSLPGLARQLYYGATSKTVLESCNLQARILF